MKDEKLAMEQQVLSFVYFVTEGRKHKDIVGEYATIYPDYTLIPSKWNLDEAFFQNQSTFSVEIKPKQGYLHKTDQTFQKCPYCLTQYYKVK